MAFASVSTDLIARGGGIVYPEVSEILSPVVSVFTIDISVDSSARRRAARVMAGLSVATVRFVRVRSETNHLGVDTNLVKNFITETQQSLTTSISLYVSPMIDL